MISSALLNFFLESFKSLALNFNGANRTAFLSTSVGGAGGGGPTPGGGGGGGADPVPEPTPPGGGISGGGGCVDFLDLLLPEDGREFSSKLSLKDDDIDDPDLLDFLFDGGAASRKVISGSVNDLFKTSSSLSSSSETLSRFILFYRLL